MGNSCKQCFGIHKTNIKYIRSDMIQSQDLSVEFENLMTNDYFDELDVESQKGAPFTVTSYMKWLSEQERTFMGDYEDDSKDANDPSTCQQSHKINNNTPNLLKDNSSQRNQRLRNWITFGDEAELRTDQNCVSDDQLTEYFLDELSRDIVTSRDILDPTKPMMYEEEEIDGPELARIIQKMRPRDLFLTDRSGNLLTTAHSSIFIGNSTAVSDAESSHLSALYNRIHQNLMKGIVNTHSAVTSERDHSSIDLDWDHEPGMNPSLTSALAVVGNDLNSRLRSEEGSSREQPPIRGVLPQVSSHKSHEVHSSEASVLSPGQVFYNEELVWDLEAEVFSDDINGAKQVMLDYTVEPDHCSLSSIIHGDKCHLLRNED